MAVPGWIIVPMIVVFAVTSLPCVVQLTGRSPDWHEDASHILMAAGMIAMLTPIRYAVPEPVWLLVFGGQVVLFAHRLLVTRGGQPWQSVHHMMAGIAMVYMGLMLGQPAVAAGHPMTGFMALGISFGMYFLAYACGTAVQVAGRPRVIEGCRALMAGGMAWVLITSL